jgi:hypothetical protein
MARITRDRGAAVAAALLVLVSACGGSAVKSTPVPKATPAGGAATSCGLVPTAADLDAGFLATAVDAPASGTVVEALLAVGGEGPSMTGRTIAFAGRFSGGSPGISASAGRLLVRADVPGAGGDPCLGTVQAMLPAEAAAGGPLKGEALVSATLGGLEVGGGLLVPCTALSIEGGGTAVECPVIGVRGGMEAGQGTLWLRMRWAGSPAALDTLPDWATALLGPSPSVPASGMPSGGPLTGHVSIDNPALEASVADLGFGDVRIEPWAGDVRYAATLPLRLPPGPSGAERSGSLTLEVHGYSGPGAYDTAWARLQSDGTETLALVDCSATVAPGELGGELRCGVDTTGGGAMGGPVTVTGHLAATWTAPVRHDVGDAVEVTWRLSGSYVSEGRAVARWEKSSSHPAGLLWVPDVRLGPDDLEPELLRIVVRGFTGDGRYTGDAVEPSIQNARPDSPRVRGQDPAWATSKEGAWTPLFGPCVATIRDGGASGDVTCPADTSLRDMPGAGPTALSASWRPAP